MALSKKVPESEDGSNLKQLLMSISGTIVIQQGQVPKLYPSLVSKDLIEEFIGVKSGAAVLELYYCNENTKCLAPGIRQARIAAKDTLYGQIDQLLNSMVKKIKEDKTSFSPEEENLIALASLPLVKKIQMDLAIYADSAYETVKAAEFVEALCYDVITNHLTKLLQKTQIAVAELEHLQLTDIGIFQRFNDRTNETIRLLAAAKSTAFRRYEIISQTRSRMQQDEAYFDMKFEEYLGNNYQEG